VRSCFCTGGVDGYNNGRVDSRFEGVLLMCGSDDGSDGGSRWK